MPPPPPRRARRAVAFAAAGLLTLGLALGWAMTATLEDSAIEGMARRVLFGVSAAAQVASVTDAYRSLRFAPRPAIVAMLLVACWIATVAWALIASGLVA